MIQRSRCSTDCMYPGLTKSDRCCGPESNAVFFFLTATGYQKLGVAAPTDGQRVAWFKAGELLERIVRNFDLAASNPFRDVARRAAAIAGNQKLDLLSFCENGYGGAVRAARRWLSPRGRSRSAVHAPRAAVLVEFAERVQCLLLARNRTPSSSHKRRGRSAASRRAFQIQGGSGSR
jgi:hypothetical protein